MHIEVEIQVNGIYDTNIEKKIYIKRCRYMAEILPIRRKTLSNQSIN